jgi:hypothetical protein
MALKIEAGKFYCTRDGRKVGPMKVNSLFCYIYGKGSSIDPEWKLNGEHKDGFGLTRDDDLIAKWSDAPDLTAITTPFGLLDAATQEALRKHGGPYDWYLLGEWSETFAESGWSFDVAYRVKPTPPAPKVETVTIRGYCDHEGDWSFSSVEMAEDTHAITLTTIDGEVQPIADVVHL